MLWGLLSGLLFRKHKTFPVQRPCAPEGAETPHFFKLTANFHTSVSEYYAVLKLLGTELSANCSSMSDIIETEGLSLAHTAFLLKKSRFGPSCLLERHDRVPGFLFPSAEGHGGGV